MALPNNPQTRKEMYLSNMAGQGTALPSEPHTREEEYLDYIAKNGGGGGTGEGDMTKAVYDDDLAVASAGGIADYVAGAITGKVDKVQGKGLSTNDYDDSAKAIVDGVTTALDAKQPKTLSEPIYVDGVAKFSVETAIDAVNGLAASNKSALLTKADTSQIAAIQDGQNIDSFSDVETALATKVDKVTGKGLSTNDYDDTEKAKVADAFPRSEQAVVGAKNINFTKYESGTWSGVTWAVNDDNSLTGNGTVDNAQSDNGANTALGFVAPFSGMAKYLGGIDVNLCVFPYDWTLSARPFTDSTKTERVGDQYGEPMPFYMEKGHNYTLVVRAKQGRELNNITVFPQILLETDSDLTYSTPAMTNEQLTEAVKAIPTVSVSYTGTASSTGVRKQQITVNNVSTDVDGSAYMEQSVTLSTSDATTVTFTNAIIADGKTLTLETSLWDLVPDDMVTTAGVCTITLPKWSSAVTIGVRLRVR